MNTERAIIWGGVEVPVLTRNWSTATPMPYRQTYLLRPGDAWHAAPSTDRQLEHYVDLNGAVMPVGVLIAQELLEAGASWACFTELFPRLTLVGADLICLSPDGAEGELVARLVDANGGVLAGLPDVVGEHPDGRVFLREAKRPSDRLQPNQHQFVESARRVFGELLDVAVVEWGHP